MNRMPRRTVWISVAGVVAVTAYAALAAVQILVLNPLAAAPGLTPEEIRVEMANANEDPGYPRALAILGLGIAMAVATAIVSIVSKAPAIVPGMTFLALLMFGAVTYFVASFSSGMALADPFGISGGDYSRWARPLYAVSALAAIAIIVGGITMTRRGHPTVDRR